MKGILSWTLHYKLGNKIQHTLLHLFLDQILPVDTSKKRMSHDFTNIFLTTSQSTMKLSARERILTTNEKQEYQETSTNQPNNQVTNQLIKHTYTLP